MRSSIGLRWKNIKPSRKEIGSKRSSRKRRGKTWPDDFKGNVDGSGGPRGNVALKEQAADTCHLMLHLQRSQLQDLRRLSGCVSNSRTSKNRKKGRERKRPENPLWLFLISAPRHRIQPIPQHVFVPGKHEIVLVLVHRKGGPEAFRRARVEAAARPHPRRRPSHALLN